MNPPPPPPTHTHTHTIHPSMCCIHSLRSEDLEWYRPRIQGLVVVVVPLPTAAETLVVVQALSVEEPTTMCAKVKMWLSVCLATMVD